MVYERRRWRIFWLVSQWRKIADIMACQWRKIADIMACHRNSGDKTVRGITSCPETSL